MKIPGSLRLSWKRLPAARRDLSAVLAGIAVFAIGLGLTAAAVLSAQSALHKETQARLERGADRLEAELERRLTLVNYGLRGARASYAVAGDLTGDDFRALVQARDLPTYFPGVRGFGFIALAPGDRLVPRHVEPAEQNRGEAGLDFASDPARREAAERAIATGNTVLSAPVTLPDVDPREPGWVLMVSLARDATPRPDGPRAAAGLLYASIVPSVMFGDVKDLLQSQVDFQLVDTAGPGPGALLFDSRGPGARPATEPPASANERRLLLHGRSLLLRVNGTPALSTLSGRSLPWFIGLGGLALSILLGQAAWLVLASRDRAQRIAAGMTSDLERMARVVERTSSAVFGLDTDGRITWANAGFQRLTGLPEKAWSGQRASELAQVVGTDPHARAAFQDAIDLRQARRMELANLRPDGSFFWTDAELQPTRDAQGAVTGFICMASDISRRKVAELRMQDSEHLMRVIADNLPARVSYWDAQRLCRFVNRRFREVFGRESFELVGAPLSPQIFGNDLYSEMEPHVEAALRGQARYFEHTATDLRGRKSSWQLHYIPDVDQGQVRGFFVLGLDVTELRQARDTALEASQSKSRFLSNMSHELRTPLNAVLGMLALLRGTPLDEVQKDYAGKAERAARSLLSLLNDILDLSKIEAGKMTLDPRPFALQDLVRDLSVILSGNVGAKDVDLHFELDPRLPTRLVGDDQRLRQVLINLGGNAVKFTERGSVTLALREMARDGDRLLLEVSVSDTGIGIASEEQARIFSDFGQANDSTARKFGGTGLGLSISNKLLLMMGSALRLDSAPGRGSRFWFELELPIATEPADSSELPAPPPGEATPAAAPPLAGLRLLLVEDNPINQQVACELLKKKGAQVDVANDGLEGLERVRQDGDAYAAVLMDVLMPVMDGHAAARAIREEGNWRLPIIAMTANAMKSDRMESLAAGMNDHVGKPFDIDDLVATLLRHIRGTAGAATAAATSAPAPFPVDDVDAGLLVLNRESAIGRLGGDT
ncbi:MAG: PAS domain-containing protein, partial [Pseudomonadota bacterium]